MRSSRSYRSLSPGSACQPPIFFPEVGVDTSDTFDSVIDDAAIGEGGDFIVTWAQFDPDADTLGRRFDRLGVPLGDPFPINAVTTNNQLASSIARDASGRFVVVWSESGTSIWGRRFDAEGTPLGGNFQINTTTPVNTLNPHVASDPSGNFVAAWRWESATDEEVKARRFDSNGAALGDEFPVNVFTTGEQRLGGVAMSPAGFVVSWGGAGSGTANGIFARLFDPAGNPVTTDLHVHTAPLSATEARSPHTAMNAAGDFVVVWDDGAGGDSHAFGRRYDGTGAPLGDVFPINAPAAEARTPHVASDAPGNFVVAWRGTFNPPEGPEVPSVSTGFDIHSVRARLYDIGGFAVSPEFLVNQDTATGNILNPRPSLAKDGSFVVAWTTADGGEYNVVARKTAVRAAPAIVMDPEHRRVLAGRGERLRQRCLRARRDPGAEDRVGQRQRARRHLRRGLQSALHRAPRRRLHDQRRPGPLRHPPPGATTSCIDGADCYSVTVSDPAVRARPALGCPVPGDPEPQPAAHLGAPPRRELPRRADRQPVLCVHRDALPQRRDRRLRRRQLLPDKPGHPRPDGGLSAEGQVRLGPHPAALHRHGLHRRPCTGNAFAPWIEELASLGITGGCGGGNYCPNNTGHAQADGGLPSEGRSRAPRTTRPTAPAIFADVPCTPGTGFSDWIEELYDRRSPEAASVTPLRYCPNNPNNRGQMAVFLIKTFGLVLYGGWQFDSVFSLFCGDAAQTPGRPCNDPP